MISPTSSLAAIPVAYSGGTPSTSKPGFGAALSAKLAEFNAMTPGSSLLHHHHHDASQKAGAVNQDAGNQTLLGKHAGLAPGTGLG